MEAFALKISVEAQSLIVLVESVKMGKFENDLFEAMESACNFIDKIFYIIVIAIFLPWWIIPYSYNKLKMRKK